MHGKVLQHFHKKQVKLNQKIISHQGQLRSLFDIYRYQKRIKQAMGLGTSLQKKITDNKLPLFLEDINSNLTRIVNDRCIEKTLIAA